ADMHGPWLRRLSTGLELHGAGPRVTRGDHAAYLRTKRTMICTTRFHADSDSQGAADDAISSTTFGRTGAWPMTDHPTPARASGWLSNSRAIGYHPGEEPARSCLPLRMQLPKGSMMLTQREP